MPKRIAPYKETDAIAARAPSTTLRAVPLPRKEAGEDKAGEDLLVVLCRAGRH
jgi:hypothetical protein